VVYDILFRAASETLRTIAADPKHLGAEIGFLAVLHTWGAEPDASPASALLVPGVGIVPDGKSWVALPVRLLPAGQGAVADVSGLFLHYLERAFAADELRFFSAYSPLHEPAGVPGVT